MNGTASVLEKHLHTPGSLNTRHYPVVGIDIELNHLFGLVANCWIPLPNRATDVSTKAIHHHGEMLLSTVTAFGPGYEHWTFEKPVMVDAARTYRESHRSGSQSCITSRCRSYVAHCRSTSGHDDHLCLGAALIQPGKTCKTESPYQKFRATKWHGGGAGVRSIGPQSVESSLLRRQKGSVDSERKESSVGRMLITCEPLPLYPGDRP